MASWMMPDRLAFRRQRSVGDRALRLRRVRVDIRALDLRLVQRLRLRNRRLERLRFVRRERRLHRRFVTSSGVDLRVDDAPVDRTSRPSASRSSSSRVDEAVDGARFHLARHEDPVAAAMPFSVSGPSDGGQSITTNAGAGCSCARAPSQHALALRPHVQRCAGRSTRMFDGTIESCGTCVRTRTSPIGRGGSCEQLAERRLLRRELHAEAERAVPLRIQVDEHRRQPVARERGRQRHRRHRFARPAFVCRDRNRDHRSDRPPSNPTRDLGRPPSRAGHG
jgi:hypothetical protein